MDSQQNQPSTPAPAGKRFNFNGILSGFLIPRVVAVHLELSPGARLLWGVIRGLSKREGYCWSSNADLARRLAVSERQIARYCRQLERAGFLETEIRAGGTPRRWLLLHPSFGAIVPPTPDISVRPPRQKRQGGMTHMSPKSRNLGVKLVSESERNINQGIEGKTADPPPSAAGEALERTRRNLDRLPPPKAEAAKATLTRAADLSELEAIKHAIAASSIDPTAELVERLIQKGQFYGRSGYQVAAAIARALKNARRSPSTAPKKAAWFGAVVENAFARDGAVSGRGNSYYPSGNGST